MTVFKTKPCPGCGREVPAENRTEEDGISTVACCLACNEDREVYFTSWAELKQDKTETERQHKRDHGGGK